MKSIGFIDYYIDEWHANNYPAWIRQSKFKDQIDVTLAWEEAPNNGRPLEQWCKEFNIKPAASIEQIVNECDAIVVLAPSNPETHQRLAELPLKSGKPVYIDKPFTTDRKTAIEIFDTAQKHNTPLMSCSALRYSAKLLQTAAENQNIQFAATTGAGSSFWEYSIHQVEMLVALLGTGASAVMQAGNDATQHLVITYPDQRRACLTLNPNCPFTWQAVTAEQSLGPIDAGDFWPDFIDHLLQFLISGKPTIDKKQTIEIAAIVENAIKALKTPNQWLKLPT